MKQFAVLCRRVPKAYCILYTDTFLIFSNAASAWVRWTYYIARSVTGILVVVELVSGSLFKEEVPFSP